MIIALLTDFGLQDGFVAACHGVVARIAPGARVLDVTHLVPPGDVRRGAALLAQLVGYLPPAVIVGVVDPGVGTARRAVAIRAGSHLLVGPDNGLLPWAADAACVGPSGTGNGPHAHPGSRAAQVREITNRALMLEPVSRTFHGRDVFSPVAAHLAAGVPVATVGPESPAQSLVRLPEPVCRTGEGWADGEILTVDRYGNLQTALTAGQLSSAGLPPGSRIRVRAAEHAFDAVRGETFGSVGVGTLVVYQDSAGLIALAVNGASAAHLLSATPGSVLHLTAPHLTNVRAPSPSQPAPSQPAR